MTAHAIATAADMPKLLGYKQLRENYGWPKRTIQEWIRARKFPKPLDLPGRDNYWALDDIVAWLKGDLARVAVTRPDDLTPEQVEDVALTLLVRSIENEIGEPVDLRGLRITYAMPMQVSSEQLASAEAHELAVWVERFADFDVARSCIMAAMLFPELRPLFVAGAVNDNVRQVFLNSDALRKSAIQAMSAASWEKCLEALKADEPL